MNTEIREKKDNIVTNLDYTPELVKMVREDLVGEEKLQEGQYHLCWNCKNGCPSKCIKVANRRKKEIGKYNFINSGYQTVNKNGEVVNFIVTKCENFEKDDCEPKSAAEVARLKRVKEGMKALYFGAESYEEAHVIQHELERRGALGYIRGKKINDKQYAVLKELVKRR